MSAEKAILLVDDNAVQVGIRQVILRRSGYFVFTALNPLRALDQLRNRNFPSDIQLIITDHIMPGMSGTEFVRELRNSHPTLPVLVISGLEEAEPLYEDLDVQFRLKPLQPERLLECVRSMIPSEAIEDQQTPDSTVAVPQPAR